jgi:hypothetical protein
MKKDELEKTIPAIVEFFTFWFGTQKTNWKGIQKEFGLLDRQINRLKMENQLYRGCAK